MYALGLATQERYEEMLGVTRKFIDRIRSGNVSTDTFHEFIGIQIASLCDESKTAELASEFTGDRKLKAKIVELADNYRADLNSHDTALRWHNAQPIPVWEQRLARAYKTSRFWDMGYYVPIDRVAARVAYKPHCMPN